jgi:hypothetical protein
MTSEDMIAIIGATGGLLSVAGHVAVLVIRELRRRPETIPPVPPPGTRSTTVTQTPPITPGKPPVPVPPKGPNPT